MKIYIKKTMQIPEIPPEVEIEAGTLRHLLDDLLRTTYFAKEIIDPVTGDLSLDGLFQVQLNGISYHALPNDLDTVLRDGDTLTLTLIWLGGG
jgi:methionine aminopeptidase